MKLYKVIWTITKLCINPKLEYKEKYFLRLEDTEQFERELEAASFVLELDYSNITIIQLEVR